MSRSVALVTFESVYPRSFVSVSFPRWFRDEKGKTCGPGSFIPPPPPQKRKKIFSLLYFLVPVSWEGQPLQNGQVSLFMVCML